MYVAWLLLEVSRSRPRYKDSRWGFCCCSFLQLTLSPSCCSHDFIVLDLSLGLGKTLFRCSQFWCISLNIGVFLRMLGHFSELQCLFLNFRKFLCISFYCNFARQDTWFHQMDPPLLLSNPRRRKSLMRILESQYHRMPVTAKEWEAGGQRTSCLRRVSCSSSCSGIDKLVNAKQAHARRARPILACSGF